MGAAVLFAQAPALPANVPDPGQPGFAVALAGIYPTVDVTGRVLAGESWSYSRGRQYATGSIDPGTGAITLDNSDGRFTSGISPYGLWLRPKRPAKLSLRDSTHAVQIAAVDVNGWPVSWPGGGGLAVVVAPLEGQDAGLRRQGPMLSSYRCEVAADDPIGQWLLSDPNPVAGYALTSYVPGTGATGDPAITFGGSALLPADSSGSLTLAQNFVTPNPATPAVFTGGGAYLSTPLAALAGHSQFSIEVTISPTDSEGASLLTLWDPVSGGWLELRAFYTPPAFGGTDNGSIGVWMGNGGSYSVDQLTVPWLWVGTPMLVAITVDLAASPFPLVTWRVTRVNGTGLDEQVYASTYVDAPVFTGSTQLVIGGNLNPVYFPSSPTFWDGSIAQLSIYAGKLTAADTSRHAQGWDGYRTEKADVRINRILGYAGWTGGTNLDPGIGQLGRDTIQGNDPLTNVQTTAADDSGYAFLSRFGQISFHNRRHRNNATAGLVLDCNLSEVSPDTVVGFDADRIENITEITSASGAVQTVRNGASIFDNGPVAVPITLNLLDDADALQAGYWRQWQWAHPRPRIDQVTINWAADPTLRAAAWAIEIGDCIALNHLPPAAPASYMEFFVEQIAHAGGASTGTTTLQLSPQLPSKTLRADASPDAYTKLDAGLAIPY